MKTETIKPSRHVAPAIIRATRLRYGLTQRYAASLIEYSMRSWQCWEDGSRKMRRITFNAFLSAAQK
jgi:DNA-binding transcriptional regulator YiaG